MRERHARKRLLTMAALAAVLIAGATAAAYGLTGHDGGLFPPVWDPGQHPGQPGQPDGAVAGAGPARAGLHPDRPGRPGPAAVRLPRQGRGPGVHGPALRRHLPIVSAEFTDAYRDLGRQAGQVVFAAVNVNQYHHAVADVAAYSRAHQLTSIPSWHFFTGPVPLLRAVWNAYNIAVQAPGPDADIVHSSAVYFIDPGGRERYLASPQADHTSSGASYLPADQIAASGRGIAQVATLLAG